MIGLLIRGLGHLRRNAPFNNQFPFFFGRIENLYEGEIIKVQNQDKDYLLFFNNKKNFNDCLLPRIQAEINDKDVIKKISNLRNKYNGLAIFHKYDAEESLQFQFFTYGYLMPSNFYEEYETFCDFNKKMLANLFRNYTSQFAPLCKIMYALSNGSPNMFLWAMTNYYKRVPLNLITDILYWFNNYNQFNGKLQKGSMTSYNDTRNILKMQEELVALRQEKRINNVFNMFNTFQKKLLKNIELTKQQREMVSHFETLSKEKQINFIRKVSTLETVDEIFHQMALLTKVHFEWNRDSFLEFITNIENLSFDIIYDNDNKVILHIKDYDTIKYVTRTTNWCISKNKRYWDDYTNKEHHGKRKQYVLFNFNQKEDSELSIVGFTTKNDRDICFAHSFTNVDLMDKGGRNLNRDLVSFRPITRNENIVNILSNLSIPLEIFMTTPSLPYEWKKQSIFDILSSVDENHYDIIKDEGNMLVFTITSPDHILSIIGAEQYANAMKYADHNPIEDKHLFIFNFDKETDDKIIWGFINNYDDCEICDELFNVYGKRHNQSLNFVLWDNKLPMTILSRPMDTFLLVKESLEQFDMPMLKVLLPQEEVKKIINSGTKLRKEIMTAIKMTLFQYFSIDLLNLLYDNEYNLTQIIGVENINSLLNYTIDLMASHAKHIKAIPNADDIQKMFKHQFNENKSIAIGMFLTHQMIWEKEKSSNLLKQWVNKILLLPKFFHKHYIDIILPFVNDVSSKEKKECIANIILNCEYYDILENHSFDETFLKYLYNKMSDTNPWKSKIFAKDCVATSV